MSLPWPNRALHPNARVHWRELAEHKKNARIIGRYLAIEAGAKRQAFPERPAVAITFNPPDNRRRDDDGIIASFKAYRDGIQDAIGVDDSRWQVTYAIGNVVPKGAVVVEVG